MSSILHCRLSGAISLLLVALMIWPSIAFAAAAAGGETKLPVVISNQPNDAKISIGKAEDARVGTKGVITRDGREIAEFEITSVQWGYSRIKVYDLAPGEKLLIGDSARIVETPPAIEKGKKSSSSKWLTLLLVIGAVAALSSGGGGGGDDSAAEDQLTIALYKSPASILADGESTSTITVRVSNASGAAVPDGTALSFSATMSAGSGTPAMISPAQGTITDGSAEATLTAGTRTGTCTITATVSGQSASTTVSLVSAQGGQGAIQLEATPRAIQVFGSGGTQTQSTVTATCLDAAGDPVVGDTVTFASNIGSVTGTATTNASGVATAAFNSNVIGTAEITASWEGLEATIEVEVTAGPPYAITVECTPGAVQCNGNAFATVTATVVDIAGNPVTNGTIVSFSVEADTNGGGNGTITPEQNTSDGEATALLYTRDEDGNISIPGTATVVAKVEVDEQPAGIPAPATDIENRANQVQFTSLDVSEIHMGASPLNIRGWDVVGNTSTVTVLVYDSMHNPVPDGTAVYFTADHGMIYGNAGKAGPVALSTTTLGQASATLVSDGSGDDTWDGLVSVTATSGDVSVTVPGQVIFSGWPSPSECLYYVNGVLYDEGDPPTISSVNGTLIITVVALDINGNPVVDDTLVSFETTKGALTAASAKTSGGAVQVSLKTSTDAGSPTPLGDGIVTVTIDSGGRNPETGNLPVTKNLTFTVE